MASEHHPHSDPIKLENNKQLQTTISVTNIENVSSDTVSGFLLEDANLVENASNSHP